MITVSLRKPPASRVLVFDRYATQGIIPILNEGDFSVFENRNRNLNVWVLLHMLLRLKCSWVQYCVSHIRLTKARVIVTGVDSDANFYRLKHYLSHLRFVAVQNGIRGSGSPVPDGDLWSMLNRADTPRPQVDFVAVFGQAHAEQFAREIECSTVVIGSARSNLLPVSRPKDSPERKRVAFISNFSGLPHSDIFANGSTPAGVMYFGDRLVNAKQYFKADAEVALTAARVCERLGMEFLIVGRRAPGHPHEQHFFDEACQGLPYRFVVKETETTSYQVLDAMDLVISIDSTLGYEMVARGSRALFVSARADMLGGPEASQFAFGFPDILPPEGPFWTRSLDDLTLANKMQRILTMSNDEWQRETSFVSSRLMIFDPGNTRLRRLLSE